MNIAIIGLGLIGGSLAKAIKMNTEHKVYGADIEPSVVYRAKLVEAIDGELTDDILRSCDIVITALYPAACVEYVKNNADKFKAGSIVMDCSGVKVSVCSELEELSANSSFTFIGAHPMAGTHFSGFKHARTGLFKDAPIIITPYKGTAIRAVDFIKKFYLSIGFSKVVIASPEEHDERIAYTSQLAHVVSSAYVKAPMSRRHSGFSAGSFKDMTRVAKLSEDMWTELFLANRENLAKEIDSIIERLAEYSQAVKAADEEKLKALLREGREIKESI